MQQEKNTCLGCQSVPDLNDFPVGGWRESGENLKKYTEHKDWENLRSKTYEGVKKWLLYSLLRLTLGSGSLTPSGWRWSNWQLIEMMSCQVERRIIMLCCVTQAHIKKKTLLRSHGKHWEGGKKKRSWTKGEKKKKTEMKVKSRSTDVKLNGKKITRNVLITSSSKFKICADGL